MIFNFLGTQMNVAVTHDSNISNFDIEIYQRSNTSFSNKISITAVTSNELRKLAKEIEQQAQKLEQFESQTVGFQS